MPRGRTNPSDGAEPATTTTVTGGIKPKAKKKRGDRPKVAYALLPLAYNDGTEIPRATMIAIEERIVVCFDGRTDEGTVKGAYRMASGEVKVEYSRKMAIVLKESEIPKLLSIAKVWAAELGQEAILIQVADFEVFFVPPHKEEG
jgi:hypothetical protein